MEPELMAHRGNSALAPENTLAAFAKALESQPDWIELDVHLSADGAIIVMHDATVDRTTNGRGPIAEMTVTELKRLDAGSWFAPEFADEPVPALEEVVALVGLRARLNVEIKQDQGMTGSGQRVVSVLRDSGMLAQSMISSFDLGALREARRSSNECEFALITARAEDLGLAITEGLGWLNLHHAAADAALVRKAHEAGLQVTVWTMNDPARWAEFAAMGADVVCSDAPHLMPGPKASRPQS